MARLPEPIVEQIRQWCEDRTPPEHRHQMRVECDVRGSSATILECRPPWDGKGDWTRLPFAQLRYDPEAGVWSLHCADRNSRWHRYELLPVSPRLERLLIEIERDPTGIFLG